LLLYITPRKYFWVGHTQLKIFHPEETMESWVKVPISDISEYYEVSSLGNVRHTRLQRLLKGKFDKDGYHIRKLNYKMSHRVHRLVALAFIKPKKG